jgi:hypothetical protein
VDIRAPLRAGFVSPPPFAPHRQALTLCPTLAGSGRSRFVGLWLADHQRLTFRVILAGRRVGSRPGRAAGVAGDLLRPAQQPRALHPPHRTLGALRAQGYVWPTPCTSLRFELSHRTSLHEAWRCVCLLNVGWWWLVCISGWLSFPCADSEGFPLDPQVWRSTS